MANSLCSRVFACVRSPSPVRLASIGRSNFRQCVRQKFLAPRSKGELACTIAALVDVFGVGVFAPKAFAHRLRVCGDHAAVRHWARAARFRPTTSTATSTDSSSRPRADSSYEIRVALLFVGGLIVSISAAALGQGRRSHFEGALASAISRAFSQAITSCSRQYRRPRIVRARENPDSGS